METINVTCSSAVYRLHFLYLLAVITGLVCNLLSQLMMLHWLMNGEPTLAFVVEREQFFVPISILLRVCQINSCCSCILCIYTINNRSPLNFVIPTPIFVFIWVPQTRGCLPIKDPKLLPTVSGPCVEKTVSCEMLYVVPYCSLIA